LGVQICLVLWKLPCIYRLVFFFNVLCWRPDLRCWLTNCHWCQLRSQHSAGTFASNQLLPNVSLEHNEKALIDLPYDLMFY
jgi:hypothetical protein